MDEYSYERKKKSNKMRKNKELKGKFNSKTVRKAEQNINKYKIKHNVFKEI